MGKEIDLENFGDAINELLTNADYQMVLTMPEGTQSVTIKDNLNMGPTLHFYALTQGLITTFRGFKDMLDPDKVEDFLDMLWSMVKEELLEEQENDDE